MRLLNVHTLELQLFQAPPIPPYAIASHRWSFDEIDLEDVVARRNRRSHGGRKMELLCNFVINHPVQHPTKDNASIPIQWLWIDTCEYSFNRLLHCSVNAACQLICQPALLGCVRRTSEVELTEAINSTSLWYREAAYCVAHLGDVNTSNNICRGEVSSWKQSEWFRRGWTLPELLAAKCVIFIDQTGQPLGHKCGTVPGRLSSCFGCYKRLKDLNQDISLVTRIPIQVLYDFGQCQQISLKARMSWINGRQTTKPEDMAYSMLGIFGINMSPIYGEDYPNAQRRLVDEIRKKEKRDARKGDHMSRRLDRTDTGPSSVPTRRHTQTLTFLIKTSITAVGKSRLCCVARYGTEMFVATLISKDPRKSMRNRLKRNFPWEWQLQIPLYTPRQYHSVNLMICLADAASRSVMQQGLATVHENHPCDGDRVLNIIGETPVNFFRDVNINWSSREINGKQFVKTLNLGENKVGQLMITVHNYSVLEGVSGRPSAVGSDMRAARRT